MFRDSEIGEMAIMPHILQFETGMVVSHLPALEDYTGGPYVRVRWKGLSQHEDRLEPFACVDEDGPQLFDMLLKRKHKAVNCSAQLSTRG